MLGPFVAGVERVRHLVFLVFIVLISAEDALGKGASTIMTHQFAIFVVTEARVLSAAIVLSRLLGSLFLAA